MTITELLLEFEPEMGNLRKMLAAVPTDKFGWKPHEKSFSLGVLANHLAAMPTLATAVFTGSAKRMPDADSTAGQLDAFDRNLAGAREAIVASNDAHLAFLIPALGVTRGTLLRNRVLSHMIHHRGQLSVYLRLLGVAVPGVYGPSADEK